MIPLLLGHVLGWPRREKVAINCPDVYLLLWCTTFCHTFYSSVLDFFGVVTRWFLLERVEGHNYESKQHLHGKNVYIPTGSMYGIFTYIWLTFMVNLGKYTIHGCNGIRMKCGPAVRFVKFPAITVDAKSPHRLNKSNPWLMGVANYHVSTVLFFLY